MTSCWQLDLAVTLGAFDDGHLRLVMRSYDYGYISRITALRLAGWFNDQG